jgi:hypothetical protein
MPRPDISSIKDCDELRTACDQLGEVPPQERDEVRHELMRKSIELDCPDAIPDEWRVKIGKDYE